MPELVQSIFAWLDAVDGVSMTLRAVPLEVVAPVVACVMTPVPDMLGGVPVKNLEVMTMGIELEPIVMQFVQANSF